MTFADIPFRPSTKTLRQFSALWLVFFLVYGTVQYFKKGHHHFGIILATLAVTIGPIGLIRPQAVRWIFVVWMVLVFPIGWFVSQMMLALLFYLVLTPAALVFKLRGRDLLARKREPERASYWLPKKTPTDIRTYFRQY
jgi:Saxitoxin biosynthesis operon protein SxtJ